MPLYLDDDQTVLQDTIREFVAEHAPVSHMRALRDADDKTGFSRDLWKQFAEMGFTGILIDEQHGGLGLGHVEAGVVLEEIGRNLSPSPFLSTAVAAVEALKGTGQAERWFPGIIAGETVAALAIDEGAKHRDTVAMTAERSGNGFKLTGAKRFVAHGHTADLIIVAARTGGSADDTDGITLFAVPKDAAGLTANAERLADSSLAARLEFEGVEVDADAVIGEVDAGRTPLDRLLRAGRTGASAELLGVGGGAMDMTIGYMKERKQFGTLIGSFQALQHRAAHLYSEMEVARAARPGRRAGGRGGVGGQGDDRAGDDAQCPGRYPDARRDRHDRRIRHRLLHEARACARRDVRGCELSRGQAGSSGGVLTLPFPGGGRGPVGGTLRCGAVLRYCGLPNWAPASAGEQGNYV
jgi:alkylation response protein AidB-like acyl-CoA dehydrogenase